MNKQIKTEEQFAKLVKKRSYQVFFLVSKVSMPFFFATHPWIVTNEKGRLRRIEIISKLKRQDKTHLKISDKYFARPLRVFHSKPHLRYKTSQLIKIISGKDAKSIINFVKKFEKQYPFLGEYHYYPGPNSNTFIQKIIDSLNLRVKLPLNAFGRNYDKE